MKKFLLSAFAALACVAAAHADDTTFNFSEGDGNTYGFGYMDSKYIDDGASFTQDGVTITINKLEGAGVRFWANDKTFRIMKKSGITISVAEGTISEITFTGRNTTDLAANVGTYAESTWSGNEATIAFDNSKAANTVQISSIAVTYSTTGAADTRAAAGLAFPEDHYYVKLGSEFVAPELTKATTAAVTYSSDKEEVATVDPATGAITLIGEGTARITATAEANEEFKAGTASYLLTVQPAPIEGAIFASTLGEGFTCQNPEGLNVWQAETNYGLKASAYINNAVNAAEAIAYTTEAIDLTTMKSAELNFEQAMNQFKDNNVLISVDAVAEFLSIVAREEGATDWTVIGEPTAPAAFSWDFYANETIDLAAWCGKKVQLGFKYVSTEAVAGTWELKNIVVTGEGSEDAISTVNAAAPAAVTYDLQGRRVIAPAHGLYIQNGRVVRF